MRLIIVDDDLIVTKALSAILTQEKEVQVLATGKSFEDTLALYEQHQPDILLLDIRMGEKTGLDAAQVILEKHQEARIVFLTTFSDREYILRALQLGARGYLLKQDYEGIYPALQAVMSGQTVFGNQITQALPDLLKPEDNRHSTASLSQREAEVLKLCARGLSNKEIAQELFLSEGTVRNYISSLLATFNLRDRTQLVVWFYRGSTEEDQN